MIIRNDNVWTNNYIFVSFTVFATDDHVPSPVHPNGTESRATLAPKRSTPPPPFAVEILVSSLPPLGGNAHASTPTSQNADRPASTSLPPLSSTVTDSGISVPIELDRPAFVVIPPVVDDNLASTSHPPISATRTVSDPGSQPDVAIAVSNVRPDQAVDLAISDVQPHQAVNLSVSNVQTHQAVNISVSNVKPHQAVDVSVSDVHPQPASNPMVSEQQSQLATDPAISEPWSQLADGLPVSTVQPQPADDTRVATPLHPVLPVGSVPRKSTSDVLTSTSSTTKTKATTSKKPPVSAPPVELPKPTASQLSALSSMMSWLPLQRRCIAVLFLCASVVGLLVVTILWICVMHTYE